MAIRRRLQSWLPWFPWYRRRGREADLERQLRDHLELEAEEQRAAGLSPQEAAYAAHRALGNTLKIEEDVRVAWGFRWFETLAQDVGYAFRMLRKSPGLAAVVVLTLALGISANAVVFSALDATLWRPLPVSKPAELTLVQMIDKRTGRVVGIRPSLLPELQDDNEAFSGLTATVADGVSFQQGADGAGSRVICEVVTANYYDTLGVRPYLGRFFAPGSDRGAWQPVVVLSYSFFKRQFGADPGTVGRTIYLNTYPFTVIGVEPADFFGTEVGSSWQVRVPMTLQPGMQRQRMPAMELLDPTNESSVWPIARLKSGVTLRRAEAVTDALFQRLLRSNAFTSEGRRLDNLRIQLKDGSHGSLSLVGELSMPLSILMCLGALVLLIACVTAANLLLIRATTKQREIGVRKALGASRKDLVQSSLMEGALLASFGCVAGIAFAYWGSNLVLSLLPHGNVPVVMDLTPNFRVLAFALIISGVLAIVLGSVPSLRIDEAMVMPVLKGNTLWTRSGERVRFETGSLPVVGQIALSVVVLILAVMFLRTVRNLRAVRVGFNTGNLLLLSLKPIQDGSVRYTTETLARFVSRLIPEIRAIPGVVDATASGVGPFSGLKGRVFPITTDDNRTADLDYSGDLVSPGFFKMMGIPLVGGRGFTPSDNDRAPGVLVITEAMARSLFGNQDPIGRKISICPLSVPGCQNHQIVGVIPDLRYNQPSDSSGFALFRPLYQVGFLNVSTLLVRTGPGNAADVIEAVRRKIHQLDDTIPIFNVRTASGQMDDLLTRQRLLGL